MTAIFGLFSNKKLMPERSFFIYTLRVVLNFRREEK